MNRTRIALMGIGLAALAFGTVSSFAQTPGQGGARQGRQGRGQGQRGQVSLASLPVETIDKVVTLTADQKTKITAIHDKYVTDTQALRPQAGQQPDPANVQKRRELTTAANRDIQAILNDEQKKKLADARTEMAVLTAAGAPAAMIGELKFTDDQKKKMAELRKETDDKLKALSTLTPEEQRTKRREINQDARTRMQALLNDEQKAQIEKYRKEHPQQRNRRRP